MYSALFCFRELDECKTSLGGSGEDYEFAIHLGSITLGSLLKPLLAAGVMGAVIYAMLGITEQLGMWCVLFAMVAAVPSYALALLAFGGLTKEDLENIPFVGRIIYKKQKLMVH